MDLLDHGNSHFILICQATMQLRGIDQLDPQGTREAFLITRTMAMDNTITLKVEQVILEFPTHQTVAKATETTLERKRGIITKSSIVT